MVISSLLNIAYLLPIVVNAFFLPAEEGAPEGINEAPPACVGALLFTAAVCFVLFVYSDPLLRLASLIGEP